MYTFRKELEKDDKKCERVREYYYELGFCTKEGQIIIKAPMSKYDDVEDEETNEAIRQENMRRAYFNKIKDDAISYGIMFY